MDSLDSQIKSLQRKKAKIAMLRLIQTVINDMSDSQEHEGLKDEIKGFFDNVINNEVLVIQNGRPVGAPPVLAAPYGLEQVRGSLQEDDIGTSPMSGQNPSKAPIKPRTDLAEFVRQYGHLGFKKVAGKNRDGETVHGTVKQMSYPYLVVAATDGNLVEIDPETAILEE